MWRNSQTAPCHTAEDSNIYVYSVIKYTKNSLEIRQTQNFTWQNVWRHRRRTVITNCVKRHCVIELWVVHAGTIGLKTTIIVSGTAQLSMAGYSLCKEYVLIRVSTVQYRVVYFVAVFWKHLTENIFHFIMYMIVHCFWPANGLHPSVIIRNILALR
jgi:CTP:phosphocholine cytidylyltransferase-like protein